MGLYVSYALLHVDFQTLMQAPGMPLRMLILTDTAILGPGGSQRFLRNLLTHLPPENYSIDVLQLASPPSSSQCMAQIDSGVIRLMYRPIEAIYAPRGLAAFQFVRRRVLRGDYQIVQSHHEKSDLISAFLPRVDGVRRISNRRDLGFQKSRRVRVVFRRANTRFDRIVAPSKCIVDALVADENADGRRCLTIPNGVDTERFRPLDVSARARLRAAFGFSDEHCLIGCVASFTPVKQHDCLSRAFALVHRRYPHTRLLLVGHGPLRADIEAQIRALYVADAVHFLGARADVENILPALDIFALASSTEGMSNAILEAQACGVAVVATQVGGNVELIEHNVNGILVPARMSDALARALGDLVTEPNRRRALAATALRRVVREYSLAAMTAAYERLYRELANGR
jgi:glycosyltransferase involved in cell wall biosynthesis